MTTEPNEREMLLAYVRAARNAIAEVKPNDMRARRLPSAMNEIGMIVETTETAANQIMDAVDIILKLPAETPPEEYRAMVEAQCMSMMEACSFQDLTGQRSTKVVETLMHVEDKLGHLAELLGDEADEQAIAPDVQSAGDDVLLNGPAMPGEGIDQDDIDRMFANG